MCNLLKNLKCLQEAQHFVMTNFFLVEEQQQLLEIQRAQKQAEEEATNTRQKRAPHCKKCRQPTKGHPRGRCPDVIEEN